MSHRLLKVIVQAVLVEDDGENLNEKPAKPIEVPAKDWPGYADHLSDEIAALNATAEPTQA